jgi:hypothetical protein
MRETMDEFCVKCRRKLRVAKVGQEVVELVAEGGKPYKCISGDVLECPECGCQVVTRFGKVTMQHDEAFLAYVDAAYTIGCLEVT